jgi:putative transposase
MNKKTLETFAREVTKSIKAEKDLYTFSQLLTKVTVETALNVELDEHLGYSKHQPSEIENNGKYPQISRSWRAHWDNLNTLY